MACWLSERNLWVTSAFQLVHTFVPHALIKFSVKPTQASMNPRVTIQPPGAPEASNYRRITTTALRWHQKRIKSRFAGPVPIYSQHVPLVSSIRFRNTLRLYSSTSDDGTKALRRADVPEEHGPLDTGLQAPFRDIFGQSKVRNAGKLPLQVAWASISRHRSKMIQHRYCSTETGQHTHGYFDGTYPTIDTQEAGVTPTSSRVINDQEAVPETVKDAKHAVQDDEKPVDDTEKGTPEDFEEFEATIEVFPSRTIHSKVENRVLKATTKKVNSFEIHLNSSEHTHTTKVTTHMPYHSGQLLNCTVTTGNCKSTETLASERATEDHDRIASTHVNHTSFQAARALESTSEAQDAKLPLSTCVTSSASHPDISQTSDMPFRQKRVGPGTKAFLTEVLTPRGILIDTNKDELEPAIEHFKRSERPGTKARKHYTRHEGLRSSTVWIDPNPVNIEAIRSNYSEMDQLGMNVLCESEWTDDAVRLLLMSEGREKLRPNTGNLPQWLPVRMREECFRQRCDDNWEIPPIIHKNIPVRAAFDFNVQPDCSYWLWTGGFPMKIQSILQQYASVRFDRALCPYLTIELKKDTKSNTTGRQQIAASGAMALYNRWKLRERYLRETRASVRKCQFSDVRHYGLLFTGAQYEVWCLRPEDGTTVDWNGCSMRKVYTGNLVTEAGIRDYINWINEIHYWGNITHGSSCVRDIEGCVKVSRKCG